METNITSLKQLAKEEQYYSPILEEYKQNFYNNLEEKKLVDFYYKERWRVGRVISADVQQRKAVVQHDGTNEIIEIFMKNNSLQPYRMMTSLSNYQIDSHERLVDLRVIENQLVYWNEFFLNKEEYTCEEINLMIRGDFFILVDFLTHFNTILTSVTYMKFFETIRAFWKYIERYLLLLKQTLIYYQMNNKELFLACPQMASLEAFPEIVETLQLSLLISQRRVKIDHFIEETIFESLEGKENILNYKNYLQILFQETQIMNLMNEIVNHETSLSSNQKITQIKTPPRFVKIIYNFIVKNSLQLQNKDLFQKNFQKINQVTDDYLENLSIEDSQWMELEQIHQLIICKQDDKQNFEKNDFNLISFETMKINILILFLKNSKYSQKFQCVSFLNAYKEKKYTKQLQDYLIKTFYKKDIVFLLYGNNSSNEIIENTIPFTDFLSQKQSFEYVQQILKFQQQADYARTQTLMKILEIFVEKIDTNSLQQLIEKLQAPENFCLGELKFLLSCFSKNREDSLMSNVKMQNIKDSTKNDVLYLLFGLIKEYSGQDKDEVKEISLQGITSIFQNYKGKNILQEIFDLIFKELKKPKVIDIYQLRLLEILTERIVISQGLLSISFFTALNQNFDKNYFKNVNILKVLYSFLELTDFNDQPLEYKKIFFDFISLLISKIGDLLLEKQYFTKCWLNCLETQSECVQQLFINMVKSNYDKKFENFYIFPLYFQKEIISLEKLSLPFLKLFFKLFLIENQKKGNLVVLTDKPDNFLFTFKQSFENCVGINHMWKFYQIFKDKEKIDLLNIMMINLHKGFTLNDTLDFAKKVAHFFIRNFKFHIYEAIKRNDVDSIQAYLELAHSYLKSLTYDQQIEIIKNPFSLIIEYNQSMQSVVLENSMSLMQLRNFINHRYLLKDQFELELKGKSVTSVQLLDNFDVQSIESNKKNQKLIRVVRKENVLDLKQVEKFFIQVLRLDESFFELTEELFKLGDIQYQECFVDFLIRIQPQNSYLNYISTQLEKKPTIPLNVIMQNNNPAKLYYFSSLLKYIVVKEFESKIFQITSLLIKRHLANFIGLLQKSLDHEIDAMNYHQFVKNLIIIFSKLIQDKIDMKDFQINIYQINSKIIKEYTLWDDQNNENLQDFISLQINLLKSQGITSQQYLAVLKQLSLQNYQNYDTLQFLLYSLDFVEIDSSNIDTIISSFQKSKQDTNLPLQLVYLRLYIKSNEYQKTLKMINDLVQQIYQNTGVKEENFLFLINFSLEILTALINIPQFDPKPIVIWINDQYFEKSYFYIQLLSTKPQIKANIFFIFRTIYQNEQHSHLIISVLEKLLKDIDFRYDSLESWNIQHMKEKIPRGDFPGLVNYGNTCYINSLVQLLFMIQPFNEYISKIQPIDKHKKLKHFKNLLNDWKFSQKPFLEPKKLIKELKTFEGLDINFYQQMDVDEFYISFIDQIELELKNQNADYLKRFFYGSLRQEIIPSNCSHQSLKIDQFASINLFIKDIDNIYKSLDTYVEWDKLEGNNQYHCNECDDKKPAKKRISFDLLPNYQIFILKRFEYNFVTNTKIKLGNKVEFPTDLNLDKYYFQSDKEELKELGYFDYKLKGIIVHLGHADGGHYFSYIQNDSGTWFEFNDKVVKIVDFTEVQNISFGKHLKQHISQGAYVLLYERVQKFNLNKEKMSSVLEGIQFGDEISESINEI